MIESGLYILCTPGGYYPYVRIGWCDRADGLVSMRNCRVIKNFGTLAELSVIAREGPKANTKLLAASPVEYTSVGLISRLIPCEEKPWKKQCPKPKS